jgi:hypothetical protein
MAAIKLTVWVATLADGMLLKNGRSAVRNVYTPPKR